MWKTWKNTYIYHLRIVVDCVDCPNSLLILIFKSFAMLFCSFPHQRGLLTLDMPSDVSGGNVFKGLKTLMSLLSCFLAISKRTFLGYPSWSPSEGERHLEQS